jgi:hypothetical protein
MTPATGKALKLAAACLLCLAVFIGLALLVLHFRKS